MLVAGMGALVPPPPWPLTLSFPNQLILLPACGSVTTGLCSLKRGAAAPKTFCLLTDSFFPGMNLKQESLPSFPGCKIA